MEEVDKIILESLSECGCDFAGKVQSLSELNTENVVEGVVRCLKIINPDLKLAPTLPPGMSARFRVGNSLANACRNAGYKGDVGYQTFLYSSETELRQIFMFLVEKLPRRKDDIVDSSTDQQSLLKRKISEVIAQQLKSLWVPAYCRLHSFNTNQSDWTIDSIKHSASFKSKQIVTPDPNIKTASDTATLYENVPHVTEQVNDSTELCSSLLEKNTLGLIAVNSWGGSDNEDSITKEFIISSLAKINSHQNTTNIGIKDSDLNSTLDEILDSFQEFQPQIKNTTATLTNDEKSSRFAHVQNLVYNEKQEPESTVKGGTEDTSTGIEYSEADNQSDSEMADLQGEIKAEDLHLSPEELRKKQEEEMQKKLENISERLQSLKNESKKLNAGIVHMTDSLAIETDKLSQTKEEFSLQEKMSALLTNPEENLQKLQALVETNAQRIASLAQQWEKHRVPLIEEYRRVKDKSQNQENILEIKLEELKMIRERIKECSMEATRKDQFYQQLVADQSTVTKSVPRHAYTKRILEIVGNIRKQKQEIENVLKQARGRQKDCNNLEGRAERTFTASDEIMFKDAKTDANVKQCFKYLVSLHTNCNNLIEAVEETGATAREIRDIEDQIETESKNNVKSVLENITKDYTEMKQENLSLLKKYKKLSKK